MSTPTRLLAESRSMARVDRLRLVGGAGTNKVMAGELSRLARRALGRFESSPPRKQGLGALVYPFDARLALLAARYHRTSARVLWDVYESDGDRLEPLYDDLIEAVVADSRPWLTTARSLSVRAFGVRDFAAGERQIVGTVKNALVDGARTRGASLEVAPTDPDVLINVRLFDGRVVVSVDLAGRPMNQRGYRLDAGPAPLREDVAAVLVMLTRFDARREPLLDPMAGSGTVAIEAACMGTGAPVWVGRRPACERLPPFDGLDLPDRPLFEPTDPLVVANERDASAVAACRRNVDRAGCASHVEVQQGDYRRLGADDVAQWCDRRGMNAETGVILSNPPYGERLEVGDANALYGELGDWCARFRGWRAAFLVANPEFEQAFGRRPRVKKPLSNGPLRGYFYSYDL